MCKREESGAPREEGKPAFTNKIGAPIHVFLLHHMVAVILLFFSHSIFARENEKASSGTEFVGEALILEAVIGANAVLASTNPRFYGGFVTLVLPIAAYCNPPRHTGEAGRWVGAITFAALGVYHMTALDADTMTKREIRNKSFIAWNATLIPLGIAELALGDHKSPSNFSLYLNASRREPMIAFSYRF